MFEITKEKMNKVSDGLPPRDFPLVLYFEGLDRYYYQTYWYDGDKSKGYLFPEIGTDKHHPSHWIALK